MVHTNKRLAILGSTGSIGTQVLEVVRRLGARFQVAALAAGRNVDLLVRQVEEFRPKFVWSEAPLSGHPSLQGIVQMRPETMAEHPEVDLVLVATSGKAGLMPTLAAIRAGKQVALANKEVLVMAGEIVAAEAKKRGLEILPVDSEHSAIFQCLRGEPRHSLERVILTASGGPFRNLTKAEMAGITPERALAHPTWKMGRKVTIDSATLMNKGMEIIEAHWLFDTPYSRIEVLVHPQSIVHSMVEFSDGSVKAQLSPPDMRLPIQYALTYPDRVPNPDLPAFDWLEFSDLHFGQPDMARFPCLKLAREAAERGGTYPAVMCAADEVAVDLFLSCKIGFLDIATIVEGCLERHQPVMGPGLDDIMAADEWARRMAAGGEYCK